MMMNSVDSDFEWKPLGESVFVDPKSKNVFYSGLTFQNIQIQLGDCIKVKVAIDDDDDDDDDDVDEGSDDASISSTASGRKHTYGYCQVIAVFMDPEEGLMVEVRWFYETNDNVFDNLRKSNKNKKQRVMIDLNDDELIEGEIIDDIPAAAIVERIQVKFTSNATVFNHTKTTPPPTSSSTINNTDMIFNCRYFKSIESNSLQVVTGDNFFQRGMEYSEYKPCYSTYLEKRSSSSSSSSSSFNNNNRDDDDDDDTMNKTTSSNDPSIKKFNDAIQKLHVSYVPDTLPCRENEKSIIQDLVRSYIQGTAASKPIYIAGIPGTGKTATVSASVASLKRECVQDSMHLPEFQYIEINCLRLQSPTDAYTVFWRCLTGEHLSSKSASIKLTNYYAAKATSCTTAKTSLFTVLLLDEIDFLSTGDGGPFYSFFNWPLLHNSRLAVIGVSNVIDLPERLRNRVQSRISSMMTRISFRAYNHEQIREILLNRLSELGAVDSIFDAKAIEFLARKASAVAGDLRAALKICQRSIQIYVEKRSMAKASESGQSVTPAITTTTAATITATTAATTTTTTATTITTATTTTAATTITTATSITTATAAATTTTTNNTTTATATVVKPDVVTHEIVKIAVDEYSQDPFKIVIRNCCQLDKGIIIAACRHMKATGDVLLTLEMLWERLQDFLAAVESDSMYNNNSSSSCSSSSNNNNNNSISSSSNNSSNNNNNNSHNSSGSSSSSNNNNDNSSSSNNNNDNSDVYRIPTSNTSSNHNHHHHQEAPYEEITLLLPPYELFEIAIQRLVRRGILAKNPTRLIFVPRLACVSLTVDIASITGALRETPFFKFL